ncbi:MAG: SCP2 sterol-binding domain-containing protein [Archangium sp.]
MIATWFEKTLPALLVSRFDDFLAVDGEIAFTVGGQSWTLSFADVEEPVKAGASKEATLKLRFTEAAFTSFIEGTLDVPNAVRGGEVKASGDLELFATLATLMMPLQRDNLGWDAT